MRRISKKSMASIGFIAIATIGLYACGGGSSSSSDPGTPTTLVTAANGVSIATCAKTRSV